MNMDIRVIQIQDTAKIFFMKYNNNKSILLNSLNQQTLELAQIISNNQNHQI